MAKSNRSTSTAIAVRGAAENRALQKSNKTWPPKFSWSASPILSYRTKMQTVCWSTIQHHIGVRVNSPSVMKATSKISFLLD